MSTIQEEKSIYQSNPITYKKNIEKAFGRKIVKVNFIENNSIFNNLTENFQRIVDEENIVYIFNNRELSYPMRDVIFQKPIFNIHSLVETKAGFILRVHNVFTIVYKNYGFMQLAPCGDDKLEITRMEIEEPNNGFGTLFLNILFETLNRIFGYVPPIMAEITGCIGLNNNNGVTSIEQQKRFFTKNGFEVIKDEKVYFQLMRPRMDPPQS